MSSKNGRGDGSGRIASLVKGFGGTAFLFAQLWVEPVAGRAVGAGDRVFRGDLQIDVRMVHRRQGAHAAEVPGTDGDLLDTHFVVEKRRVFLAHAMLLHG